MEIALYQPDIAQNTGTLLRLGACLEVPVHIIEPCGFIFEDKRFLRAGMDYIAFADWQRHISWTKFHETMRGRKKRLVLLSTRAKVAYTDFRFESHDVLLLGRESAGVPGEIHELVDARVLIPMREEARSLNIAVAAAMVLGEALRQTGTFPDAQANES